MLDSILKEFDFDETDGIRGAFGDPTFRAWLKNLIETRSNGSRR